MGITDILAALTVPARSPDAQVWRHKCRHDRPMLAACPIMPVYLRGVAQSASARGLGPRGPRFESGRPDSSPTTHPCQQARDADLGDEVSLHIVGRVVGVHGAGVVLAVAA